MSFFSYITIVAKEKMGGKKWEFDEKKFIHSVKKGEKFKPQLLSKFV